MVSDVEGFDIDVKENNSICSKKKKGGGFQSFGLSFPVLKGLKKRGYRIPTPIQRKSIPIILKGRDVVGMARTGSGKTACFLLPMFEKLLNRSQKLRFGPRALILTPTRELALQTLKFAKDLGKYTNLKILAILGGDSMDYQFDEIHNNPDVIVATPGRFLHLCIEMDLKLTSVEYVVFDEADRLFEMGFGEQLKEILDRLGVERQTVLFSATLPKLLVDFAKAGLINPVLLRLDVETKVPDTLELVFFSVKQDEKLAALLCILNALPENSQTLVFVSTKHHVEYLHKILDKANISSTYIYSDLDASARKINTGKFQNKKCSVLIVTDIAARGMDIPQLDYVINYHFPPKSKLFVHRVGRCARAGRTGTAFSLVSSEEIPYLLDLHLFLGKKLNLLNKNNTVKKNIKGALGKIPSYMVESQQSDLISWHENDEIASMEKICGNGYKKYLRSRPGAAFESVKRAKEIDFSNLEIHPFFESYETNEAKPEEILEQMRKYKPKGTIFELNLSNKSKCYAVMKNTKKAHERQVLNFKKKLAEIKHEEGNEIEDEREQEETNDNEVEENFSEIITDKRKKKIKNHKEIKKKKFISEEYYVPYFASDDHTEKGLSINNSFSNEAHKAAFDFTGDCDKELRLQKQIKKWDKKRKNMVTVPDQKVGKIKTESGNWISASYKSNRYDLWKKKNNLPEVDHEDEENNNKTTLNRRRYDFPNTPLGRYKRRLAEREKAKAGLIKPENIFKARRVLEKKRQKSIPRSKRKKFTKPKNN